MTNGNVCQPRHVSVGRWQASLCCPAGSLVTWAFLLAIACSTAAAEVIHVDADAAGLRNGSSWYHAFNHLQDALAAASNSDEIRVAEGVYRPDRGAGVTTGDRAASFRLKNGVTIKGGYAGYGEPDPNARSISTHRTTLSGDLNDDDGPNFANNDDNSYHVLTGSGTNTTAILDGFTVTAGNASDFGQNWGGGMYNNNGNPTVRDCTFKGNRATYGGGMGNEHSSPVLTDCTLSSNLAEYGGGMYNRDNSSPTLTDCTFSGNGARYYGGGMYNYTGSSPTVTDCRFTGNYSVEWGSGGFHNNYDSNPTLTNCTFSSNHVPEGAGGMGNYNSNPVLTDCTFSGNSAWEGAGLNNGVGASPSLTNCTFTGNSAVEGGGVRDMGSATLTNCTFSTNSASYTGGGLASRRDSTSLTYCTFTGNSARNGGGIACCENSSCSVRNCLLRGNSASTRGGALFSEDSSPTIVNCTIADNSSGNGAALGCDSTGAPSSVTLKNCISWNGGDEISNNDGSTIHVTYSDVQGVWSGAGNIAADPFFVSPSSGDYHLLPDSPCIDAGDPSSSYSQEPEPNGGRINMGRYGNTPEATSRGEVPTVVVPDVVGMSQTDAHAAIISAELTVASESHEDSDTVPEGHVISQNPAAGTSVMVGYSVALVISLGPPQHRLTVTISSSSGGSVTIPGEGVFQLDQGTVVSIVATPDNNYHFVNWTGTAVNAGKVANPDRASTTIMVDTDYTLRAIFGADLCTIHASAGPNGTISPIGAIVTNTGGSQQFAATPDAGYAVQSWHVDGGMVQSGGTTYTLHNIQRDHTVRVTFMRELMVIYVDDDAPGDPGPNNNAVSDPAEDGSFDHPFDMIQEAIDAATDGRTAIILPGTYRETIDFSGKNITVTGTAPETLNAVTDTVIDADGSGTIVTFDNAENANCILNGMTLTGGDASNGGAIYCGGSSKPTISNCIIIGNLAMNGGGIYCRYASPTIVNCTIVGNLATHGGAIYCWSSHTLLANCIIWSNSPEIMYVDSGEPATIVYSDVQDGWPGDGNVDCDPCFVDGGLWDDNGTPEELRDDSWIAGDYHLKSQAGSWDVNRQIWVTDDVTSPCIDAADIASYIGFEPFPNGGVINMGAYGGTAEASKSYFGSPPCRTPITGDLNGDCKVNLADFALMVFHWLEHSNSIGNW